MGKPLERAVLIFVIAAIAALCLTNNLHAAVVTEQWGENSNCEYTDVYDDIAYINSGNENATGVNVYGRVGDDSGSRPYRSLIRVDLDDLDSLISNSNQILSATLHIKKYGDDTTTSSTIGAYQMKKSWEEDIYDYEVPSELINLIFLQQHGRHLVLMVLTTEIPHRMIHLYGMGMILIGTLLM